MRKTLLATMLSGALLAPAVVVAQTGSGSPGSGSPSAGPDTTNPGSPNTNANPPSTDTSRGGTENNRGSSTGSNAADPRGSMGANDSSGSDTSSSSSWLGHLGVRRLGVAVAARGAAPIPEGRRSRPTRKLTLSGLT